MKITNEQIEIEIEILSTDAHRLLTSAKETFTEYGKVRLQIALLRRLRALRMESDPSAERTSYQLLGFVVQDESEPSPFCALTWTGELLSPKNVHLFLKVDWESIMPVDITAYFAALLNDWKVLVGTTPEMLLVFTSELSVGPLRTIETATLDQDRASIIVRQKLGTVLEFT